MRITMYTNKQKNKKHTAVSIRLLSLFCGIVFLSAPVFSGCSRRTSGEPSGTVYLNTTESSSPAQPTSSAAPTTSTAKETTTAAPTEETTDITVAVTVAEPKEITLVAVGDMLLHGGIHNSSLQPDGTYNYSHVFEHVRDRVMAADIAVANQEVILGGTELGVSSYPEFNSPQEFGDYLVDTGFDVILHASNHTMDKDTVGVLNTIHFWKEQHPDITYLGINENEEERSTIRIVESNGLRIAMLNYTYGLNGFSLPKERPYLINLMDEQHKSDIAADLKKAREEADFVIVYPHWGTEYVLEATDAQKEWAQFFADNGADLIIGTHPHVLEPVEQIEASDGRQVLVYYSLGNFISIQYYNYSMLGGFAEVTIRKDGNGTYISDYDMDFLVTHYTAGRTEMTTYFLSDYTDEMAGRHAILTEPYQGNYAEAYKNVNQWYPFTVEGLWNLARQICPEFVD